MGRQGQLRLWPEEQEVKGDTVRCMAGEWLAGKEPASPFEMEKPVLDEVKKWVLAVYLRGEARKKTISGWPQGSSREFQLSLGFPSEAAS